MADNWESLEGYSKIEEMYGVTVKFIVNKTTRKDEVEKTESTYLEKVKNTMKKLNYEIYTKPYILNIVGIRSKTRVANKFDDPFEFDSFMKLAKIQVEQGKTKFTYTLIHEEDLK